MEEIKESIPAAPLSDDALDQVSGGAAWANSTHLTNRRDEGCDDPTRHTYTVKSGDTLFHIATKAGVSMDDLVTWNQDNYPGLKKNRNLIYVGWELVYYK